MTASDPHPDGTRTLFFELNGQPREVNVRDKALRVVERAHPKADPADPGQVGAPTAGVISGIAVQANQTVERGAKLLTLEAMKMQSNIYAPISGPRHQTAGVARTERGSQRSSRDDRPVSDGQLRKHENFRSNFLRNQRNLVVYLPPGYDEQPQRRFPVLYLHDGQNLFDGATSFIPGQDWHVGQTADARNPCGARRAADHRRNLQHREKRASANTRRRACRNSAAGAPIATENFYSKK